MKKNFGRNSLKNSSNIFNTATTGLEQQIIGIFGNNYKDTKISNICENFYNNSNSNLSDLSLNINSLDDYNLDKIEELDLMKFPDKIKSPDNIINKSAGLPSLDFQKIKLKYKNILNIPVIKNSDKNGIKVNCKKNFSDNLKNKNNDLQKQVKESNWIIKELKEKLEKIKKYFLEKKEKFTNLEDKNLHADTRINKLLKQLKCFSRKNFEFKIENNVKKFYLIFL